MQFLELYFFVDSGAPSPLEGNTHEQKKCRRTPSFNDEVEVRERRETGKIEECTIQIRIENAFSIDKRHQKKSGTLRFHACRRKERDQVLGKCLICRLRWFTFWTFGFWPRSCGFATMRSSREGTSFFRCFLPTKIAASENERRLIRERRKKHLFLKRKKREFLSKEEVIVLR